VPLQERIESPFTPGVPVPQDYFVAREKEVNRLRAAVAQASSGRSKNIFLQGERGIGKTSLAAFACLVAQREFDFVGTICSLGAARTVDEVSSAVFRQLLQHLPEKSLFDKAKEAFDRYIKSIGVLGFRVEFTSEPAQLAHLRLDFIGYLRAFLERVSPPKQGIFLALDDLNGVTGQAEFTLFVKSVVDQIATTQRPWPLVIVLVGVPTRREEMIRSHPSVGRIFDVIELGPFTQTESSEFFETMFAQRGISVEPDALELMVNVSGGLPALMHEVGDAVFSSNADDRVDLRDAKAGVLQAADAVGRKYLDPQVYRALRSDKYRSILRRLGRTPLGAQFSRHEALRSIPSSQQKSFDSFLRRTRELGIICPAETRGRYRFANQLYQLYVRLEAYRALQQPQKGRG